MMRFIIVSIISASVVQAAMIGIPEKVQTLVRKIVPKHDLDSCNWGNTDLENYVADCNLVENDPKSPGIRIIVEKKKLRASAVYFLEDAEVQKYLPPAIYEAASRDFEKAGARAYEPTRVTISILANGEVEHYLILTNIGKPYSVYYSGKGKRIGRVSKGNECYPDVCRD